MILWEGAKSSTLVPRFGFPLRVHRLQALCFCDHDHCCFTPPRVPLAWSIQPQVPRFQCTDQVLAPVSDPSNRMSPQKTTHDTVAFQIVCSQKASGIIAGSKTVKIGVPYGYLSKRGGRPPPPDMVIFFLVSLEKPTTKGTRKKK